MAWLTGLPHWLQNFISASLYSRLYLCPEAAGLVPIARSDEPEVVLTLRASGLSPHGGEVAFPGGRRDPEDADLIRTALREAQEEIGLAPGLVEVVGPLSTLVSRHGIQVTP